MHDDYVCVSALELPEGGGGARCRLACLVARRLILLLTVGPAASHPVVFFAGGGVGCARPRSSCLPCHGIPGCAMCSDLLACGRAQLTSLVA